jgi:hypothetical protein
MDPLEILAFGLKFAEQSGTIKVVGLSTCVSAIAFGSKGIIGFKQEENDAVGTVTHIGAWLLVIWGGLNIISIILQAL